MGYHKHTKKCDGMCDTCDCPITEDTVCCFCGRTAQEVNELVAISKAAICSECVSTCVEILKDHVAPNAR